MRKIKLFSVLAMLLVGVLAYVGVANAAELGSIMSISEVRVNDVELSLTDSNRFDVVRGDEIDVQVEIRATGATEDVWIEAFLGGYEYEDFESVSDKTHTFDVKENTTYLKKLTLKLPHKLDAAEDYKLRILVVDKNNDAIIENYKLLVDKSRHELQIKDTVFSPEGSVQAGRALLATVRVKNYGDKIEDSVKVTVSIPELGVSASDYIDEIESGESESSEELYLRIPSDAETGDYTVKVSALYDEDYEKDSKEYTIRVAGVEQEDEEEPAAAGSKTILTIGAEIQDVAIGTSGAIYPITITNLGSTAKTYIISADSANWATIKISPSNVVVVEKGESKAVYLNVAAKDTAQAGEQVFTVSIKSGDKTLKEMLLKANVVGAKSVTTGFVSLKRGLEIGLVILVVLLVILGLIIGFNKLKGSEDEDKEDNKTYY